MNNVKYWEKRALLSLTQSERLGKQTSQLAVGIYERAYKELDKELADIYRNYSNETGLDVQRLKTLLSKKETDKVWKQLEKQGFKKYIKNNYKARINIIEQKQAQIYAKIKQLHQPESKVLKRGFKGVINQSYYKTIYDLQQGTGLNLSFSKLNTDGMNEILNYNWSGVKFSTRAFYNNGKLADDVVEILGAGMLSGTSFEKMRSQMKEKFDVENYKIDRLIRTESNYFHNQATAKASESMGFNYYILIATLDDRTSQICQDKNKEKFKYSEMEVGTNYPPFHPNCRTKATPYVDVDEYLKERREKVESVEPQTFNEFIKTNDINTLNNIDKNGIIDNKAKNIAEIKNEFEQLQKDSLSAKLKLESSDFKYRQRYRQIKTNLIPETYAGELNNLKEEFEKAKIDYESIRKKKNDFSFVNRNELLIKNPKTLDDLKNNIDVLIGTDTYNIELKGLDRNHLEDIQNSINIMSDKFPILRGKINSFSMSSTSKSYADCTMLSGNIRMSKKYFNNFDNLAKQYTDDLNAGFHPLNTDVNSILEHEMAHRLDGVITEKLELSGIHFSSYVCDKALKETGLGIKDIATELSRYGKTNKLEFFAEAIAESVNSKTPRALAQKVDEIVQNTLKMTDKNEIMKYLMS